MKKKTKEPLHCIAARIPKQCACEILTTLFPVCEELGILLSARHLVLPDEGFLHFPMPLRGIYGTLVTRKDTYILCENGVFHHFERKSCRHEVVFLNECEPDFDWRLLN